MHNRNFASVRKRYGKNHEKSQHSASAAREVIGAKGKDVHTWCVIAPGANSISRTTDEAPKCIGDAKFMLFFTSACR
jgi:hypothetical protein